GRVARPMRPRSRSAGVSATSTEIVVCSSPWESTPCAPGSGPRPAPQPSRKMAAVAVAKSALDEGSSLEAEEELLALEAAGVPDEAAGRADGPRARNGDR